MCNHLLKLCSMSLVKKKRMFWTLLFKMMCFSLLTGRLFCNELGWGGGGGVGSWVSSFLLRTSQKRVQITGTPHKHCNCFVTNGIDSLSLERQQRERDNVKDVLIQWHNREIQKQCALFCQYNIDIPIINSLREPAQHWVPVCEIGFLLRHISLTVWQHICQILDKVTSFLL